MADDTAPSTPARQSTPAKKKRGSYTPFRKITKQRFLDALRDGASVTRAAAAAGCGRRTAYLARQHDEAFAGDWEAAIEAGTDALEDEAVRRALTGVKKPVGFHQGIHQGTYVTDYSDTLLMFLLKGRRPEKFKDRTELSVGGDLAARLAAARRRVAEETPPTLLGGPLTGPPADEHVLAAGDERDDSEG